MLFRLKKNLSAFLPVVDASYNRRTWGCPGGSGVIDADQSGRGNSRVYYELATWATEKHATAAITPRLFGELVICVDPFSSGERRVRC
jgi:hypothetical protein